MCFARLWLLVWPRHSVWHRASSFSCRITLPIPVFQSMSPRSRRAFGLPPREPTASSAGVGASVDRPSTDPELVAGASTASGRTARRRTRPRRRGGRSRAHIERGGWQSLSETTSQHASCRHYVRHHVTPPSTPDPLMPPCGAALTVKSLGQGAKKLSTRISARGGFRRHAMLPSAPDPLMQRPMQG